MKFGNFVRYLPCKMILEKLTLIDFKNFGEAELGFSSKVNCFAGPNGSGKTNLFDALHYLSLCKSFFNPVDSQNIRHDAPFFLIQGYFRDDQGYEEAVYCGMKRGQKKVFKRNNKEYERLSDHIGHFPLVMISPADSVLIAGGSEERRKLMDSIIAQYDAVYLNTLIDYNRILAQRNALLKNFADSRTFDASILEVLDAQLCEKGKPVHEARKQFTEQLLPIFNSYYSMLSGDAEQVELVYQSQLFRQPFEELLREALPKDRMVQHTTAGIHKDDLEFSIGPYPLKKTASQGQQKTFLIALRLAQYAFLRDTGKRMPLLLLDDIYDKLDAGRVARLMDLVCGDGFGQIFVTDTGVGRMQELFEGRKIPFRLFNITKGQIN